MIRNKWKILVLFLVLLGSTFFFIKLKAGSSVEIVKEIRPFIGDIKSIVTATAIVQPQNRLEIKPPINGRLDKIMVKEGQQVRVGDVLIWMSSTERAALLDAARAHGEEELKYWQDVYKPTPLISPIDGEVIVSTDEPGQTVTSSEAVMVLSDHLIVQAQVDETDIGALKVGQDAVITLDAYPEIKVMGKIDHIYYESKIVNNVTIYQVDIIPETVPAVFRSGMSATVDIVIDSRKNTLLIPSESLKHDNKGSYVFVLRGVDKDIEEVRVRTGIADEKNIEIVEGLSRDDIILIKSKKYTPLSKSGGAVNPLMPSRRREAR